VFVEGPSGAPIPGVTFELYTFFGGVKTGASDSSGTHLFDAVASGEYGVVVFPPPGFTLDPPHRDGILVEGGSESAVTFRLNRCEGRVRVLVQDESGAPIPGIRVTLYRPFEIVSEGVTADTGTHDFDVVCGLHYGVVASLVAGFFVPSGSRAHVDGLSLTQSGDVPVRLTLGRCQSLTAEVRDTDGLAVAGAEARLYLPSETVRRQLTDGSGRTSFTGIACAQYGVELTPPSGYETLTGERSIFKEGIDIAGGGEKVVTFELRKK
jgi:hypothetical protein